MHSWVYYYKDRWAKWKNVSDALDEKNKLFYILRSIIINYVKNVKRLKMKKQWFVFCVQGDDILKSYF